MDMSMSSVAEMSVPAHKPISSAMRAAVGSDITDWAVAVSHLAP